MVLLCEGVQNAVAHPATTTPPLAIPTLGVERDGACHHR
jgi:hypothetical protein